MVMKTWTRSCGHGTKSTCTENVWRTPQLHNHNQQPTHMMVTVPQHWAPTRCCTWGSEKTQCPDMHAEGTSLSNHTPNRQIYRNQSCFTINILQMSPCHPHSIFHSAALFTWWSQNRFNFSCRFLSSASGRFGASIDSYPLSTSKNRSSTPPQPPHVPPYSAIYLIFLPKTTWDKGQVSCDNQSWRLLRRSFILPSSLYLGLRMAQTPR